VIFITTAIYTECNFFVTNAKHENLAGVGFSPAGSGGKSEIIKF
jgi:hypothetical protein